MRCFSLHLIYPLLITFQLGTSVWGNDNNASTTRYPSELILRAGIIQSDTFKGFFDDLIVDLQKIALGDNVALSIQTEGVGGGYQEALSLIAPDCLDGETRIMNNKTYDCGGFDFLIGDFWPNSDRYELYDFTPAWLTTSLSALKTTFSDITSLTEATKTGSVICGVGTSYFLKGHALKNFPDATIESCLGAEPIQNCLDRLENDECSLFVADELVLRKIQSDKPNFELTGEHLIKQYLAWPVRKNLDPEQAFLLNKWIYSALSNQVVENLYVKYFEKKRCPLGRAGTNCDRPCDPIHGLSDASGECVCQSVRWSGDDCSIEVPEELNMIPDEIKYTAYAMFGLNASIILLCAVWLYYHWWSPQVRFSQPLFLLLVLFGCFVSSSTIIAMAQEDDGDGPVKACITIPWLYTLGFSITFGSLFAKIRRIYSIFNQQCERPAGDAINTRRNSFRSRGYLSTKETLLTIGGVLLLDFVLLALWTALDPLHWERVPIREDQFGNSLESQGYCTSDHWESFFGSLVAVHLSLVASATYMCYKARGIPTEYSEHKYVTVAMISNLQLFMLGIPVLVIASTDPIAHFFVRSAVVWMNDLVVITLIFGHLIIRIYKSNAALNLDKVQGAVNGIQRRRSGDHARRLSLGDSERSDGGYMQRRHSYGGYAPRRPSLGASDRHGYSDRYSPAMQIVPESGGTGPSSIDLASDEESSEINMNLDAKKPNDTRQKPSDSSVSDISLSGFEPSESSEDDHNSGSTNSSRWRTNSSRASKQQTAVHAEGDVPMIPVRDQTIVEEMGEESFEEDSSSSSTDHGEMMSPSQNGSVDVHMQLSPIEEVKSEDRYRPSICSVLPPFMPYRSPTESPSSNASTMMSMQMSPKSVSTLRRKAVLSPHNIEAGPKKPIRLDSEHDTIDHSSVKLSPNSVSTRRRETPLYSPSQTETPPNKPIRLESEHEAIDNSAQMMSDERPVSESSGTGSPHDAPMKPVRFVSETDEVDSRELRIPELGP